MMGLSAPAAWFPCAPCTILGFAMRKCWKGNKDTKSLEKSSFPKVQSTLWEWKAHLQRIQGTPIAPIALCTFTRHKRRVHLQSESRVTELSSLLEFPILCKVWLAPQYGRSGGVTERIRGLPVLAALVTCFSPAANQSQASRSCFMNWLFFVKWSGVQPAGCLVSRQNEFHPVTDVPHHVCLMKLQEVQPRHHDNGTSKFESIRDPSFHPDVLLIVHLRMLKPILSSLASKVEIAGAAEDHCGGNQHQFFGCFPDLSQSLAVGDHVVPVLRRFRLIPDFENHMMVLAILFGNGMEKLQHFLQILSE